MSNQKRSSNGQRTCWNHRPQASGGVLPSGRHRRPHRPRAPGLTPWALFEPVPTAIVVCDSRGRLETMNAEAELRLGCRRALLKGTFLASLAPEFARDLLSRPQSPLGVFAPLGTENQEYAIRSPYGISRYFRIQIASWLTNSGKPYWACLLQPAESQFTDCQQLQRFFELSLDFFCIASLDGFFLTINSNFSKHLGYSVSDLTSRSFLSFVHPQDCTRTASAMRQLADGEILSSFCNRYRDSGGNYHWLEWTARSIPAEKLIFAVARDVTDRIHVEQQLKAAESRKRTILDNTPAVIYIKDREGRYQFVNREFSRLFHVTQEEAFTKTDFDIFPADLAAAFRQNDRYVIDHETPLQIEEIALQDDGPHTYLSLKCPVPSADGQSVDLAGISTDITDRVRLKRTTEELRLAEEVQRHLFPQGDITVPGFDIFGKVVPASQLCGDYFDFVPRPDGHIAFCVADVSGHGVGPALEMVETRAILRMLLKQPISIDEVVGTLNQMLCEDTPENSFVTLLLAELEPETRTFRYIGAGHDALLVHSEGEVQRLPSTSCLLGMFSDVRFATSQSFSLRSNDLLLICTDGVPETMSPERELFGLERMAATLQRLRYNSSTVILHELFATARAFSREPMPRDDMTGVLIKAV